tara:strand:+ start:77 stop:967 length:891 start_codon:yes stop_codon:yes gene_type:complete
MNLLQFIKKFPNEISCKTHFIESRKRQGIVCKKCSNTQHYWLQGKEQFQCKSCKFRSTLRSGTILQSSKLPFKYWYVATHLMSSTKKGFSAHEVQRQLGHNRYEPIWLMMGKIRTAMGKSERNNILKGMVEMDEAYISTHTSKQTKKCLKRGKGSQKKQKIIVMAESFPLENNKGLVSRFCGQFSMQVNKSEFKQAVNEMVSKTINSKTILFTDMAKSYVDLNKIVDTHIMEKSSISWDSTLQWSHIAIANLKRNLLGVYHFVKNEYLQGYLDEFCYKLNRRKQKDLFQNLIFDLI